MATRILPHLCDAANATRPSVWKLEQLFHLMADLCESTTVSHEIVMANLPKVFAGIMANMGTDHAERRASARGHAARVLAELADASGVNATTIAATGGFGCLVRTMRKHPAAVDVQAHVFRALRALCFRGPEIHTAFLESGALPLVLAAMDAHIAAVDVQEKACALMLSLVSFGGAGKAAAIASGVMPRLIAARDAHPAAEAIITTATAALDCFQ